MILALGGIMTGIDGKEYDYTEDVINKENSKGVYASLDRKAISEILELARKEYKN